MKKNILIDFSYIFLLFFSTPSYATISTWNIGELGGSGSEFIIMYDNVNSYTWQEAQDWGVNNLGGNLAFISSSAMQNAISNGLNDNGVGSAQVWIGGKRYGMCIDPTNGSSSAWEWITGETWSYTNWDINSPNNCSQECTRILGGDHFWDDANCNSTLSWAVFEVDISLPIEMSFFEAKTIGAESVQLIWQTISEINNLGFHIEHSTNGENWEKIVFISGSGTTNNLQEYIYIDQNPIDGVNYYRLKQEDFDGHVEYSNIISITIQKEIGISIYPNPTNGKLYFSNNADTSLKLQLVNCNGKIVMDQLIDNQSIDISELSLIHI